MRIDSKSLVVALREGNGERRVKQPRELFLEGSSKKNLNALAIIKPQKGE
jgi:hypothetical protein